MNNIKIRGARVHNLKNVDLDLPVNKLICFSGPSGSGKSSLAFHTLHAESKRRFLNSYPNAVKFFIDRPAPVDVDLIYPVLPVFGLPQTNPIIGARAVVADIMRLTDSLQNLYFSYSKEYCPEHQLELESSSIIHQINQWLKDINDSDVIHIFFHKLDFKKYFSTQISPVRSFSLTESLVREIHEEDDFWEVIRFKWGNLEALEKKLLELKLDQIDCSLTIFNNTTKTLVQDFKFSFRKKCPKCKYNAHPVLTVSAFSPYSALGACKSCNGYGANLVFDEEKLVDKELSINEGGLLFLNYSPFHYAYEELIKILKKKKISSDVPIKKLNKDFFQLLEEGEGRFPGFEALKAYLDSKKYKPSVRIFIRKIQKEETCQNCLGSRLNSNFKNYRIQSPRENYSLSDLMFFSIDDLIIYFSQKFKILENYQERLIKEILNKLKFASGLGLGHLKLLRKAKTLSSGEYQRLLLLKYLSFEGTDSLFVLDEPSVGLDKFELEKMLTSLRQIVDQGNTVIVVDHSDFIQKNADYLVVMGPGSGKNGGELIYSGESKKYFQEKPVDKKFQFKKILSDKSILINGAEVFNHVYPDFKVPIESITWVTGASGSGKSACLVRVLANYINKNIYGENLSEEKYRFKSISGAKKFSDVIVVSSNLNRFTSRSNLGTITELSSVIRKHFLKLPVAKSMNLKEGHLSPNSELGMCPKCEGKGVNIIEMQYLEDIVIECEDCRGLKVKPIYANISDGHMTLAESYQLPLNQVLDKIELTPKFKRVWEYLKILNLDYLSLERSLSSLSGGEKQRIYLLSKLLKKIENSFLILENISFGLSHKELLNLGELLHNLTNFSNTIVIVDSSEFFNKVASYHLHFDKEKISLIEI